MNFNVYEIEILKALVQRKLDMPQYEDVWFELNSIMFKLNNLKEVN